MNKKIILDNGDYKLLRALCSTTQANLKKTLISSLKKRYKNIISNGKYVIAQGDIPIALVAHMDTVFKYPPTDIYYDREQNVIWSPDGLGADDRAGIFAILQIIKRGFRPTIILTEDEESGCIGATDLVTKMEEAPWKINFCIQLDRRGYNDCVFYDCDNRDFVKYIESFGFEEKYGSYSDIAVICPDWGMAGVNLSVGYKDEHTVSETLHPGYLMETIEKVCNLLSEFIALPKDSEPEFEYIPITRGGWNMYGTYNIAYPYASSLNDDDYVDNPYEEYYKDWSNSNREAFANFKCSECGRSHFYEDEILLLDVGDDTTAAVCYDCIESFDWCTNCDMPFRFVDLKGVCPRCGHNNANG